MKGEVEEANGISLSPTKLKMVQGEKTGNVEGKIVTCTVTVKQAQLPIGEYVEYGVGYQDISSGGYKFEPNDGCGWRILSLGDKKSDGSYSSAKIISTGIPAGIIYVSNIQRNNSWWDTAQTGGVAYQAASGLSTSSKFESVLFNKKTSTAANNAGDYNLGYYTEITNRDATSTVKLTSTNDSKALFYLKGLKQYNYNGNVTNWYYWIASAGSDTGLRRVEKDGEMSNLSAGAPYGIRPVITLNYDIYKDGDIWKIK